MAELRRMSQQMADFVAKVVGEPRKIAGTRRPRHE
jgi:hypothetical protein